MKLDWIRLLGICVAIIAISLFANTLMAQGNGNGNGNGNNGGDETETFPPPPQLTVRYRVKMIPMQPNLRFYAPDVSEAGDVVGWYDVATTDGGTRKLGYRFNAYTETYQTSDEMFVESTDWASLEFVGVNNFGAIVGRATSFDDVAYGFLAYPDGSSTTGWSFEILPVPDNATLLPGLGSIP